MDCSLTLVVNLSTLSLYLQVSLLLTNEPQSLHSCMHRATATGHARSPCELGGGCGTGIWAHISSPLLHINDLSLHFPPFCRANCNLRRKTDLDFSAFATVAFVVVGYAWATRLPILLQECLFPRAVEFPAAGEDIRPPHLRSVASSSFRSVRRKFYFFRRCEKGREFR